MFSRANMVPLLLALPPLAVSLVLPWQTGWIWTVAVIVVLGVPHGTLDVEIGRNLLRGRVGGWWFPVFAVPYLLLVGIVLLAWRWAPEATLAAFLTASVWHFGTEGTDKVGLPTLFSGGLPIAVPVLLHPQATAQVFSAASGLAFNHPPTWLVAGSIVWLVPAALTILRSRPRELLLPGALLLAFVVLPPLTAFTLYFVAVHAPAHTAALIRHPSRAPRVQGEASAWWLAAPTTILTIAIGAVLWPFYDGAVPVRLLCLTLQLLAAFTLPHMILDAWLERREPKDRPATRDRWRFSLATMSLATLSAPRSYWKPCGQASGLGDQVNREQRLSPFPTHSPVLRRGECTRAPLSKQIQPACEGTMQTVRSSPGSRA